LNPLLKRLRPGGHRERLQVLFHRVRRILAEFDGDVAGRDVRVVLQVRRFPPVALEAEAIPRRVCLVVGDRQIQIRPCPCGEAS
jgi:hypothetical protein